MSLKEELISERVKGAKGIGEPRVGGNPIVDENLQDEGNEGRKVLKKVNNLAVGPKYINEKKYIKNKLRVQFDVNGSSLRDMDALMEIAGLSTRKELFNNALALFKWAVEEKRKGWIISSLDEVNEKYREIVMPALSNVQVDL